MPAPKARTWVDGLDNLGENLIRLATGFEGLDRSAAAVPDDVQFARSLSEIASGFRVAFRQAQPVLLNEEANFLSLVPAAPETSLAAAAPGDDVRRAHTLVHEGVLAAHGMLSLLDGFLRSGSSQPAALRRTIQPALRSLAESSSVVGWELRAVCHEYRTEVRLAGESPETLTDLTPGWVGLIHDMSATARRLRLSRREWFRTNRQLASASGFGALVEPEDESF